jgi:Gpi18-like mannosyltransferase
LPGVVEGQTTHRGLSNWLTHLLRAIVAVWRDESIRFPTLVFMALRLFTGIAAVLMVRYTPVEPPVWLEWNPSGQTYAEAFSPGGPLAIFVEPWHRWDTAWYAKIAIQGYRAGDPAIVFPPLYPAMIALLAPLCGSDYVLASLFISNIACLAALILLFKLTLAEFGSIALARRSVICLAVFPTAYYLVAGYTESLFLALTLGAFLAAIKHRWLVAGSLAALASLTRLQGAILLFPLGWIAYVQLRQAGLRALLARLPTLIGPPLGALAYTMYLAIHNFGSYETAFAKEWQLYTRFPWEAIRAYLERRASGPLPDFENDNAFILVALALLGLVVLIRFRPAYTLYVWTTLVVLLLRYHEGPQFESIFRYAVLIFPGFIALGLVLRRWWLLLPYAAFSLYWQLILLDRFIRWIWVA